MNSTGMAKDRALLLLVGLLAWVGMFLAGAAPVVILDPGHGGDDSGAVVGRVYEKHLNLDLAYRVARHLQSAGWPVRLTRDSDRFLTLGQRTQLAGRFSSAVVVSLHFNWTGNTGIRGIETYHAGGARSVALDNSIHRAMILSCGASDRGVRQRHFFVVRETRHPAVLIEGGYLSNPAERRRCCSGTYRDQLARGIAASIMRTAH